MRGAGRTLTFTITVYALDQSVRGAYLDRQRGYFNGPCVFALPEGRDAEPIEVTLEPPPHSLCEDWRVATALAPGEVDERGFGVYHAQDYDELLDHPVEIGEHESVEFEAGGVPHHLVVAGRFESDLERVAVDLKQLCTAQIEFFGTPAPFDRYWLLGLAVGDGYGGLEHRASTSLIFSRDDLPKVGETGQPRDYQRFLALVSHEYFHAWHVKRTKPAAFMPYRLDRRIHTRLLWVFEGITSYYQELLLLRSGVVGVAAFLQRLGELLTRVYRLPGRFKQSLAESSFDAWDVLYRPEPHHPNTAISYYTKGAMVALALDLKLRLDTAGRTSLDDVVRELWLRYGARGIGVPEDGFEQLAAELSGLDLEPFFASAVRGTDDPPLKELLAEFGVALEMRAASGCRRPRRRAAGRQRRAADARRCDTGARAGSRARERARRRRGRAGRTQSRRRVDRDRSAACDGSESAAPSGAFRERRARHGQRVPRRRAARGRRRAQGRAARYLLPRRARPGRAESARAAAGVARRVTRP